MNKKKFWIVGIMVVIIIAESGFIIFNIFNNKNNSGDMECVKEEIKLSYDYTQNLDNFEGMEIDELKNVDKDSIYGFAIVNDKLVALNSKGEDVGILNSTLKILDIDTRKNMLYIIGFDLEEESYDTYVIDLNNYPYKLYKLSSDLKLDNTDFDFNNNYLFYSSNHSILRYNFKTKTEETIMTGDDFPEGILVYGNNIYYRTVGLAYYTMDFDGNNKKEISQKEYKNVRFLIDELIYYDESNEVYINMLTDDFLIKNSGYVKVDHELANLYYEGEKIYSVSDSSRWIEINYVADSNIIAFTEGIWNSDLDDDWKYFYYYIDSGKIEEVSEDDVFSFEAILFDPNLFNK